MNVVKLSLGGKIVLYSTRTGTLRPITLLNTDYRITQQVLLDETKAPSTTVDAFHTSPVILLTWALYFEHHLDNSDAATISLED